MEAPSEYVHVAHTFFAPLGADSHAQSALVDKKFPAPEISRNFIKSALSVGKARPKKKSSAGFLALAPPSSLTEIRKKKIDLNAATKIPTRYYVLVIPTWYFQMQPEVGSTSPPLYHTFPPPHRHVFVS